MKTVSVVRHQVPRKRKHEVSCNSHIIESVKHYVHIFGILKSLNSVKFWLLKRYLDKIKSFMKTVSGTEVVT
jgi:hypothetical protein